MKAIIPALAILAGATACTTTPEAIRGTSQGKAAWTIDNGEISLTVTEQGTHTAPVLFRRGGRTIQPYHISPWQGEGYTTDCKVLEPLRGDFFCLPFGGNGTAFNGEKFPPHGETCGEPWKLEGVTTVGDTTTASFAIDLKIRAGHVVRNLSLVKGQPAIYSRTVVTGFAGPASFAHHAILPLPAQARSLLISTSPFELGMTPPYHFDDAQSFASGKTFETLALVPLATPESATDDCSSLPAPRKHTDLLAMYQKPAAATPKVPAWLAAVNTVDHTLWFSLKDPVLMPARVMWIENYGRQGAPWSGRNRCVGLEDGCMFFDAGIAESVAGNVVNRQGVPTFFTFTGKPTEIRYIEGAIPVPETFGRVASAVFGTSEVTFTDVKGQRVTIPVNHQFLFAR